MEIKEQEWNKLVRDKVPEWIQSHGGQVETEVVEDDAEYDRLLRQKLVEEAQEIQEADKGHLLEELGDVQTVIDDLLRVNGFAYEQLRRQQMRKDTQRGTFSKRIFLKRTKGA